MVSFVVRISIIFLWHVATGDKCYLQSICGSEQLTAVQPTDCEGRVGDDIELICSFNHTSEVLSSDVVYKWQKAREIVENNSYTIKFLSFKHSDAGGYQCEAISGDGEMLYCGQVALTTAPYARGTCAVNSNAGYNCSCRVGVMIKDHCADLLTVDIGGYPPANLTWVVDDVMATNDSQAVLTLLPNGSALADVQLWSLSDYKDISIIGHNEVGSVGICVWRKWNDPTPPIAVRFNLSITPVELKKGANDVTVISCSSNLPVGDFYICYSKNLSDLQRLAVNDEHCCYCSSVATPKCGQKFPNWKLMIDVVEQINQVNCHAVLKNVTEDDAGFYQCRVYDLCNYPCKRRYGDLYNYSISTCNDDSSSTSHFSVPDIAIYCSSVALLVIIIIIITLGVIIACWRWKNSSSRVTHKSVSVEDGETCQPLLRPRQSSESGSGDNSDEASNHHEASNGASIGTNAQVPVQETCDDHGGSTTLTSISSNQAIGCNNIDNEGEREPSSHESLDGPSVDNAQVPVQETCDACGCTALASHVSQAVGTRSPFSHRHKAHVICGSDAGEWVNSELTKMLCDMNVEEECAIAGRLWLSEITRMTKKGYKVIFVVSRSVSTSRFEIMLNQVIFNQNFRQPCLIPIMFNCTLDDIDHQLKELLRPYVLLHHYDDNLYTNLKKAVCDKCC